MKIDFDMLDKLVSAGATGGVIVEYLRAEDAKRAPKRKRESGRQRTKRGQHTATNGNVEQQSATITETPSQIAERELYARGKQLCGNRAGGLISRLLQHHGYDIGAARKIVEVGATKNDPREYIVGSMRSKNGSGNATMAAFDDLISRAEGGEVERDDRIVDVTPSRS